MFKKRNLPEVEPVKLKPFHSIRPGVYILILWALAIMLIAFLLFVLPGLVLNTAYICFDEPVMGSGVYEDGIYLGSGNDGVYKTKGGEHSYSFVYEGEEYGSIDLKVKRKVFFSLFSHKPQLIVPVRCFTLPFLEKTEDAFIRDVSIYSKVLEETNTFHFPPIFETFASNVVLCGVKDVKDIWLLGASHITSSLLYLDYQKGKEILKENHILFESEELNALESVMKRMWDERDNKETIQGKGNSLPSYVRNGDYYTYYSGSVELGREASFTIQDLKEAPVSVSYDTFSIKAGTVTEHDWALFISENPKWSKNNIQELLEEGLVDENYLKGITPSLYVNSIRPIRNISWYAAEAYTSWLSEKEGVVYSLPTEAEWTAAALSSEDKDYVTSLVYVENNSSSPTAMLGQVWEFTSTPYVPLARCSDYEKLTELSDEYGYDDVIIKGGSYISDPSCVDIHTVGVAARNQCSEFCGFRVVKR